MHVHFMVLPLAICVKVKAYSMDIFTFSCRISLHQKPRGFDRLSEQDRPNFSGIALWLFYYTANWVATQSSCKCCSFDCSYFFLWVVWFSLQHEYREAEGSDAADGICSRASSAAGFWQDYCAIVSISCEENPSQISIWNSIASVIYSICLSAFHFDWSCCLRCGQLLIPWETISEEANVVYRNYFYSEQTNLHYVLWSYALLSPLAFLIMQLQGPILFSSRNHFLFVSE